jgi:hypothetical protein
MAWDDTQTAISEIGFTDWNSMVTYTKSVIETSGVVNATSIKISGTAITSSAAELNILDGVTSSTAELNILDGVTAGFADINKLTGLTTTATELGYVHDVTSAIQTQLNAKLPVELITPTVDHTYSGLTRIGTAGETLAIWDVCYLKSDGKFWKANATLPATTRGHLALATGAMSADGTGQFLIYGYARDNSWTSSIGGNIYVNSTAGGPTQTQPTGTGKAVRIIGQAYSAITIFFNPDNTYVELT